MRAPIPHHPGLRHLRCVQLEGRPGAIARRVEGQAQLLLGGELPRRLEDVLLPQPIERPQDGGSVDIVFPAVNQNGGHGAQSRLSLFFSRSSALPSGSTLTLGVGFGASRVGR